MDRHLRAMTVGLLMALSVLGIRAQGPAETPRDGAAESRRLRAKALDLGYNLDHAAAMATFGEAIAADPTDPAPHRLAAATIWIQSLFQQGAVTADDYLGQARSNVERKPLPPELAASFRAHLNRALELSQARLRANPRDADAHFQVGAAYGFLASYTATVEGRVLGGFGDARRAYREHKRVLELDPSRTDAGLIVGMYRYAVSLLPVHWRLVAGLAGFDGGREQGVKLVEQAAATPSDIQTNARFTLIVIYNREERYDEALRVIEQLQTQYPRNRLLWLEQGTTALRARRFEVARVALEQGLSKCGADPRPRAFGEEARWRYSSGAALVGLNDRAKAERELRAVLALEAPRWLQGRAHKELGKLGDLAGDRPSALAEYRVAARLCRAEHDSACVDEAEQLAKAAYR
jgi:tetratricopeptide (TPR) repeat protein